MKSALMANPGDTTKVSRKISTGLICKPRADSPQWTVLMVGINKTAPRFLETCVTWEEGMDLHIFLFEVLHLRDWTIVPTYDKTFRGERVALGADLLEETIRLVPGYHTLRGVESIARKMLDDFPEVLKALWIRGLLTKDVERHNFEIDSISFLPPKGLTEISVEDTSKYLGLNNLTVTGSVQLAGKGFPLVLLRNVKCRTALEKFLRVDNGAAGDLTLSVRVKFWIPSDTDIC